MVGAHTHWNGKSVPHCRSCLITQRRREGEEGSVSCPIDPRNRAGSTFPLQRFSRASKAIEPKSQRCITQPVLEMLGEKAASAMLSNPVCPQRGREGGERVAQMFTVEREWKCLSKQAERGSLYSAAKVGAARTSSRVKKDARAAAGKCMVADKFCALWGHSSKAFQQANSIFCNWTTLRVKS